MDWANQTKLPAMLYRAAIDETTLVAAVIARITYRIDHARLVVAEEQPWVVSAAPWAGPEGPMPSDEVFRRGGVDLMVFGSARAPSHRPVTTMLVRVGCGAQFAHEIAVVGDRFWRRRGREFAMTPPLPFLEMPIGLDRAFGGKSLWDGLEIACPDNPLGKGFCADEDAVEGTALPNLEDPHRPIRHWRDSPEPVGLGICPPALGSRLRESVRFDDDGILSELRPTFFNVAFPSMVVPRVAVQDVVWVEGMTAGGPLHFEIPPPPLKAHVRIGNTEIERPLELDQIGIQATTETAFLTFRYPFRYTLRPREKRSCTLTIASQFQSAPTLACNEVVT